MDRRSEQEIDAAQRALLDELESVSSILDAPKDQAPAAPASEIPLLLDVVEIPVLDTALSPRPTPPAERCGGFDQHAANAGSLDRQAERGEPVFTAPDTQTHEASAAGRTALHEALETEAAAILEDLLDEFIPRIEARFRQRLEARLREMSEAAASKARSGS